MSRSATIAPSRNISEWRVPKVEIAYLYGQYSMLSMVANALNID
jgi:hypothetical protein